MINVGMMYSFKYIDHMYRILIQAEKMQYIRYFVFGCIALTIFYIACYLGSDNAFDIFVISLIPLGLFFFASDPLGEPDEDEVIYDHSVVRVHQRVHADNVELKKYHDRYIYYKKKAPTNHNYYEAHKYKHLYNHKFSHLDERLHYVLSNRFGPYSLYRISDKEEAHMHNHMKPLNEAGLLKYWAHHFI